MQGVNKWKDELAAMTRERNKLAEKLFTALQDLKVSREAITHLTERNRTLESKPAFDINSIFGGLYNGKP